MPSLISIFAASAIIYQIWTFTESVTLDLGTADRVAKKAEFSGINPEFQPTRRRRDRSSDLLYVHLPNRVLLAETLKRGEFPPYAFVAEWESAALYPLNRIYAWLPTRTALQFEVTFHLLLAAFGIVYFSRLEGRSYAGGLLAAACFIFSGQVWGRFYPGHLSNLATLSWVPLILALATKVSRWPGAWALAALTGALTMFLFSGHPQYIYFAGLVFAILVLSGWFGLRPLPRLALAAVLATIFASPQLIPAFEAFRSSARQSVGYSFSASFYYPVKALVTAVDPFFFGHFDDFKFRVIYPKRRIADMGVNAWEASAFFGGAGALLLAARGLTARYGLAAAATLILALGKQTPVYDFLYHHLPGFRAFRGSGKFIAFTGLFLALAVAKGFDMGWRGGNYLDKIRSAYPKISRRK